MMLLALALAGLFAGYFIADVAEKRWPGRGATTVGAAFAGLAIGTAVAMLSGCGALFAPSEVEVVVTAPSEAIITLDDLPSHTGTIQVEAHHRHIVGARVGGQPLGLCSLEPQLQARYLVGDILLFETVVSVVVDGVTNDWEVIETDRCDFGGGQ